MLFGFVPMIHLKKKELVVGKLAIIISVAIIILLHMTALVLTSVKFTGAMKMVSYLITFQTLFLNSYSVLFMRQNWSKIL